MSRLAGRFIDRFDDMMLDTGVGVFASGLIDVCLDGILAYGAVWNYQHGKLIPCAACIVLLVRSARGGAK